jgi:hypothetical protein
VAQDPGWLLVAPAPHPAEASHRIVPAPPDELAIGPWAALPRRRQEDSEEVKIAYAELLETVRRLREQHLSERQEAHERLRRMRSERVRATALRERIAEDVLRRRRPPSS